MGSTTDAGNAMNPPPPAPETETPCAEVIAALEHMLRYRHDQAHNGDVYQGGPYDSCPLCADTREKIERARRVHASQPTAEEPPQPPPAEERNKPLAPDVLASALQDRIVPASGRLLAATPIDKPAEERETPDTPCVPLCGSAVMTEIDPLANVRVCSECGYPVRPESEGAESGTADDLLVWAMESAAALKAIPAQVVIDSRAWWQHSDTLHVASTRMTQLVERIAELTAEIEYRERDLDFARHHRSAVAVRLNVPLPQPEGRVWEAINAALDERDACRSQLTSSGYVPYLDRMKELAKRAEAAEQRAEDLARQIEQASAELDELVAPDPSKPLAQRIRDEFADFKMVLEHCSAAYMHMSDGQISKPNTLPSVVCAIADDCESERTRGAIAEARREWESQSSPSSPSEK